MDLALLTTDDLQDIRCHAHAAADGTWRGACEIDCGGPEPVRLYWSGPCDSRKDALATAMAWRSDLRCRLSH